MKVRKFMGFNLLIACIVALGITSCGKSTKGNSSATGWKINDKKGGYQVNSKFKKQDVPPGMVHIEGGAFTMGKVQDDPMKDWNNTASKQHVMSFFMDETEVTNNSYGEYLYWLKTVFPPEDDNYKNIYMGAIPDTLVWRSRLGYAEDYVRNYLRHPAFMDYPVVGVNWVQATEFAKWRTDRVNEDILERNRYIKKDAKINFGEDITAENTFSTETYIASPTRAYGGKEELVLKRSIHGGKVTDEDKNVYAQRNSGLFVPEYRLPTEAEWEYAALAMVGNREFNAYKGQKKYPWKGRYTRSSKRKQRGDQLANFKQGKGDYGGIAGWSDDNADLTNRVKFYPPNAFGLYDMAGNVAEWVADVYRPMVDDEMSDFNYFRGNIFTKNKLEDDGRTATLITTENIKYDTLSNGKVVARNLPGHIAQVPVDDNETFLRTQFSTSDNRNYHDGDAPSTRNYFKFGGGDSDPAEEAEKVKKYAMYDAPQHKISKDSAGTKMIKQHDKSTIEKRTSLVDDNVRVYKGGSWRDRAYWLDPAQRRYFPQDMATDYIGFRCAMAKLGIKTTKKTTKGNPKY